MISTETVLMLATPAAFTTLFSLFNKPSIRDFRNLGILATYVVGVVAAFRTGPVAAALAWTLLGLSSGLLYFLYELWGASRSEEDSSPTPATILHGLLAWPVMLPEVVEYSLAELGFLGRSASEPNGGGHDDESNAT